MPLSDGYFAYINSDAWYRKRERWIELADYECEWCSEFKKPLHIHHLSYENFGRENEDDVIVLCRACHLHADEIRKLLKGWTDEPFIRKLLSKRGYPFNMKRTTRKHVIKFKKRIKETQKALKKYREGVKR